MQFEINKYKDEAKLTHDSVTSELEIIHNKIQSINISNERRDKKYGYIINSIFRHSMIIQKQVKTENDLK